MTQERITGPASYFASIEKTYGRPIGFWLDLVRGQEGMGHMQLVGWLKETHGLGHGHANAIVAHAKAGGPDFDSKGPDSKAPGGTGSDSPDSDSMGPDSKGQAK